MSEFSGPRVAIVDFGMGNLYSVQRACAHAGLSAQITGSPEEVLAASGVILPGVGAMPHAMRALDASGLSAALRETVARGTPLFGVCLGMQLLMTEGSEFGPHAGLGLVPGVVRKFEGLQRDGTSLKVPHIGWNQVKRRASAEGDPWAGTPLEMTADGEYMYFVHSYYVVPEDPAVQIARTRYGDVEFCSALTAGSVYGCQFHPERSGPQGLRLYQRVARLVADRLIAGRGGSFS
jgi:glutamine amidotransferase